MCGIVAIIRKEKTPVSDHEKAVKRILSSMSHRGPDGNGVFKTDNITMIHARLAIIDPQGGKQPLHQDNVTLIGNGEIYNYVELNEEIRGKFSSGSDFEPVMYLLSHHGISSLEKLKGMYALFYLDKKNRRWIVARDRYGIKPLYKTNNKEYIIYASQPEAIFAFEDEHEIDHEKALELLECGYISGNRTIYKNIERVGKGEVETCGSMILNRINTLPAISNKTSDRMSFDKAVKEFDRLFEQSVLIHQRSDVDFGMFLSGGLDSTALLTMMARLNDNPVKCFTCGFEGENAKDERKKAENTARALGAEYHETVMNESDFWELLPKVAKALDDPIIDYATLPTYKLAMLAKDHVKVVLSGEGGDEALAGYGRYRKAKGLRKIINPPLLNKYRHNRLSGLGILRDEYEGKIKIPDSENIKNATAIQKIQARDFESWLPDNLLIKQDRCLMANSLEGRTPFLEPELTDFCFLLPDEFKIRKGLGKYLLRYWLSIHGPENYDCFAKKQGFTVPVEGWIMNRKSDVINLLEKQESLNRFLKEGSVATLFEMKSKHAKTALWSLLFYAIWHKIHIEKENCDYLFDLS